MVSKTRSRYLELENALKEAGAEDFQFEARLCLEFLKGEDAYLKLLTDRLEFSNEDEKKLCEILKRRESGEPIQYILGEWEFFGYDFYVGEGVLIPRQDTETLVELSLLWLKTKENAKVADLCSGTGCIPITLSLKKKDLSAYAVELYDKAYSYLEKNVLRHSANVKPVMADVLSEETARRFSDLDLITSNPPYLTQSDMLSLQREVEFEPKTALFGGNDGLTFYREISRLWKDSLKNGGMIAFEIGITQAEDVKNILTELGYKNVTVTNDLTGRPRVVSAIK